MSKGLEALHHPRIELARIDISAEGLHDIAYMPFYKTKQYATIEEELKRLEELEKAFVALSEDDEKAKKLLSKEIEKNRAFEIIKNSGYISIDTMLSQNYITRKEYDLLKGVGL